MRIYIFTQRLGLLGNMSGFYFVVPSQVIFDKHFMLDYAGWAHIQGSWKGSGCLHSTTLGHSPSREHACHSLSSAIPLQAGIP